MAAAAAFAFAVDRLTKIWALAHLTDNVVTPFLPRLLQFRLTSNTGAAFSLGEDKAVLMTIIATTYTAAFLWWGLRRLRKSTSEALLEVIGIGLIVGGACGNLFERYTVGRVTDFLEFAFVSFPIFNFADAIIDVGLVLIFLNLFLASRDDQARPAEVAEKTVES